MENGETVRLVLGYTTWIIFITIMVVIAWVLVAWYKRSVGESGASVGYVRAVGEVIEKFVLAAEQVYRSEPGQRKKAWVLEQVETWTERRGIPFDPELADALIEAAVYAVINGPDGIKTKEVKAAISVENSGGDPASLHFIQGDAPVLKGPPPVRLEP